MRTGIFVASYAKDFQFLRHLLRSIKRFCHGFHRVSIAVPLEDKPLLEKRLHEWGMDNGSDNLLVWTQCQDIKDGFMRAQHAMMNMNLYLWDCQQYLLVGSDCMFWNDVTPDHYMHNGKPAMRIDSLSKLKDNPTWHWATGTEKATGFKPEFDYMRSLPLVYTPTVLEVTRARVREHTSMTLHHYINQNHKDFSESNVMGICAHKLCPDEYSWFVDRPLPTPTNLLQFWSHGGLDRKMDRMQPYTDKFGNYQTTHRRTAREVILDILND